MRTASTSTGVCCWPAWPVVGSAGLAGAGDASDVAVGAADAVDGEASAGVLDGDMPTAVSATENILDMIEPKTLMLKPLFWDEANAEAAGWFLW